jgi:glycine dehydrogenase subunit 1
MFPYIPHTEEDVKYMLDTLGMKDLEDLFADVPKDVRMNRELKLEAPKSELEVQRLMNSLAIKNKPTGELTCFLGAGAYDHYIPTVVKHITGRSEFYTAYTPYQAEISQGTLQAIFEFQTMIANLTGMDLSNASMYDGSTATAESASMAADATRRKQVLISETVHPETRQVLETYAHFNGIQVQTVPAVDGVMDLDRLKSMISKETAGLIVQNPNFFGIIEEVEEAEKLIHEVKGLLIMNVDPISLGVLKAPGDLGADIVVGEGHAMGNPMSYGGPYLGFLSATEKLMRKMPGRIAGQTTDVEGNRGYVLTLQTREQHIRREKATSNICSNQALNALAALVYMSVLGKKGIQEVARQSYRKAHHALEKIEAINGYKRIFDKPFFKEFVVGTPKAPEEINEILLKQGILGGYQLGKHYPDLKNGLLFCVTEKRTLDEIDQLVKGLEVANK